MSTSWAPASEYEGFTAETQKARVKEILRSGNTDGVCSLFFYSLGIPNGRTRVYELRDGDGLDIETVRCPREFHDRSAPTHVRFIWHWRPEPRQLGLLRAR